MNALTVLVTALVCYLLGNHNGAICISNILHDDVRSHGSGNAGLTNFVRSYGTSKALLVVAIDVSKAVLACLIAGMVFAPYGYQLEGRLLGGLCVMLGHDFPVLQGFRGGKGILSGWFIAWTVDWRVGLALIVVFATVYLISGYVSLSSVLAAVTFGAGFIVLYRENLLVLCCSVFMSVLTIFMHRANIIRLIKGNEPKTNLFKKKGSTK